VVANQKNEPSLKATWCRGYRRSRTCLAYSSVGLPGKTIRTLFHFLQHTRREPVYVWIAFLFGTFASERKTGRGALSRGYFEGYRALSLPLAFLRIALPQVP
jgi:hypothetical protein